MISVQDLSIGEVARIVGLGQSDRHYRHRLLAMGLTPGTLIQLIRVAPLGDPIQILSRDCSLCLRKQEASLLFLEKVVT